LMKKKFFGRQGEYGLYGDSDCQRKARAVVVDTGYADGAW
jgi:hypothetical protein